MNFAFGDGGSPLALTDYGTGDGELIMLMMVRMLVMLVMRMRVMMITQGGSSARPWRLGSSW